MPTSRIGSHTRNWFALSCLCVATASAQSPALRIAQAVSPAPSTLRADATVLGYDSTRKFVTLRKGTNDLICLADDPRSKNFHVSCYFKALEPFMARGRALRAQGLTSDSADSIRAHEIAISDLAPAGHWSPGEPAFGRVRGGTLAMPKTPTALYQYAAPRDQVSDSSVKNARYLYIVYMPYATPASTGLTAQPLNDGGPWLMYPGKPWAHIMIAPTQPQTVIVRP
jgi:hypothetical protein